ncbi:hypothetical protein IAT40_003134 [Kwoniella sp. CBS 6097]
MVSQADIGPISSQYAAAATVPLIKSPSLWLPKPVEMPNDIHPLPEDITAYFVYPFSLEEHILSIHPSPADAISQRRARNAEVLHRREVEEEQREKDALRKIAPGYNPSSLLIPSSSTPTLSPAFSLEPVGFGASTGVPQAQNTTMITGGSQAAHPSHPSTTNDHQIQAQLQTQAQDPMDDLVSRLEEMESTR